MQTLIKCHALRYKTHKVYDAYCYYKYNLKISTWANFNKPKPYPVNCSSNAQYHPSTSDASCLGPRYPTITGASWGDLKSSCRIFAPCATPDSASWKRLTPAEISGTIIAIKLHAMRRPDVRSGMVPKLILKSLLDGPESWKKRDGFHKTVLSVSASAWFFPPRRTKGVVLVKG